MAHWTRTTGVIFLAAMSVYSNGAGRAIAQVAGRPASSADSSDVRLIDDAATPVATDASADQGRVLAESRVDMTDDGTLSLHFTDLPVSTVLTMLSQQTQRNILPSKDVKGSVSADLYDVTLREALDAILKVNGYGYREQGNFIYVYSQKELDELTRAERQPVTEVIRLHYANAADVSRLVVPLLSDAGEVSISAPSGSGIDLGKTDAGGDDYASEDILVVRDYPDVLEKVVKAIEEIDRRPQQVLVEATIMRARLNENNTLGVNFTVAGGVDFNTLANLGGGAAEAATVDDITSGAILDNPGAGGIMDSGVVGVTGGGSGLNVGIIKNNVGLFITALEGVTDTTVMANPKVLVLNKQRGYVVVGNEDGYRDTTTVSEGGTSTVGSVKYLETGTRLVFRPFIGEGGYIRMEVHPEDSSGAVDRITGLPSKATTEVTTNVMVKDGRTIVIGGLFREATSITRQGTPGLSSLPVVGALFRQKTDETVREEVIILLTPHIVKDTDAYADASEAQLLAGDRIRVGMRRGLMWFGRERLSEAAYESAVHEWNKPNPNKGKVLWHLDNALSMNPQFLEAIELKEEVSGQRLTSVDNSSARDFVRKAMASDPSPATTSGRSVRLESTPAENGDAAQDAAPQSAAPATQPVAVEPSAPAMEAAVAVEPQPAAMAEAALETATPMAEAPVVDAEPAMPLVEAIVATDEPMAVPSVDVIPTSSTAATEVVEVTELSDLAISSD